jgi:hypothetical protein
MVPSSPSSTSAVTCLSKRPYLPSSGSWAAATNGVGVGQLQAQSGWKQGSVKIAIIPAHSRRSSTRRRQANDIPVVALLNDDTRMQCPGNLNPPGLDNVSTFFLTFLCYSPMENKEKKETLKAWP